MKRKNTAEKYFYQKDFSILEIILIILMVVSVIVLTFIQGGGPIGFLILFISIAAFFICRSLKIKDAEIDQILEKIIQDNQITCSDNIITAYDLKNTVVKKRKDGKLISPNYYITDIMTSDDGAITLNSYAIDLINSSVKAISYSVDKSEEIILTEETIKTNVGSAKMSYLKINSSCMIPVTLSDYKASKVVESIIGGK